MIVYQVYQQSDGLWRWMTADKAGDRAIVSQQVFITKEDCDENLAQVLEASFVDYGGPGVVAEEAKPGLLAVVL